MLCHFDFTRNITTKKLIKGRINQRPAKLRSSLFTYIYCANGFEVWNLPIMSFFKWQRPHLFYDTFAVIDAKGNWCYHAICCTLFLYLNGLFSKRFYFFHFVAVKHTKRQPTKQQRHRCCGLCKDALVGQLC